MVKKIQLVVWHKGSHRPSYYQVTFEQGWRVDCETREIVIGGHLPRKIIPLDNVLSYEVEELNDEDQVPEQRGAGTPDHSGTCDAGKPCRSGRYFHV